eukprot:476173_1
MYALSNRHNYCPKQYRKWGFRYQSILCQFQAYSPDIICIQETTPSTWKHKMQPRLKKLGYIGIHAARELVDAKFAGLSQSDCVIWKENKFTKIKHKILRLNKFIKKNNNKNTIPYDQHYDTLLGSNKSMFRSFVASCYDVVIVLHFKCNQTNKQFIVCSSHFYWDPNNPEVKSTQALIFNRELEKLLKEWSPDFMEEKESVFDINKIPIVFGVDSNSLPWKDKKDKFDLFLPENGAQSGVYRLMINGKLERTHKDHPYCRINEREKRYQKKHNGSIGNVKMSRKEVEYVGELCDWEIGIKWRSVYSMVNKRNKFKEPMFTNRVHGFTDTIDYIFISDKCDVKRFLEMPWQKELSYHMLIEDDENDKDDNWIEMELKREQVLCKEFGYLPNIHHPSDHLPLCADIIIH